MSYCQIGDSPTVYYKFKGQSSYSKVFFSGIAPIDIQLENISSSNSNSESDSSDNNNNSGLVPCPANGTLCKLTATAYFLFAEGELGYQNSFSSQGWQFKESVIGQESDPDRFDEDTGEAYQTYRYQVIATSYYRFQRGVLAPQPPDDYYEEVEHFTGFSISDSCFPNGGDGLNCYDPNNPPPPPPPPPPSPSQKNQIKIKVIFKGQIIWSQTGEAPADYQVSCKKDECPPGFIKLKSTNSQDFCCIECDELKQEIATIKLLVRQTNG